MKRFQTGEVELMMAIVWRGSGHVGMGHGTAQAEKSGQER